MDKAVTVALRKFPQIERRRGIRTELLRSLYARATNNSASFLFINRRYIAALNDTAPPALSSAGARIAEDLSLNGIAFAKFDEVFDADFLEALQKAFDGYADEFESTRRNAVAGGKGSYLDTVHKSHTFVLGDVATDYCGAPAFAAIAARYMGMVPRFIGSSFWRTRPLPPDNGSRQYSQLWHRDYNDRMLMKAFLYLTDVGLQEGFFEYVAGSHARGPMGELYDRVGPDGFRAYPDNTEVERLVESLPSYSLDDVAATTGTNAPWHGKPAIVRCIAPRGTLIFADTFGLHRGGYVQKGVRDLIMTTHSTNFNVHKPHFAVTPDYADKLDAFMRLVFGVD